MIIIRLHGGLGNQMFQYSLGKSLSLAHNLPFAVDFSYLRSHNQSGRSLRLRGFNVVLEEAPQKIVEGYAGKAQKIVDALLPFSKKKHIVEESPKFNAKILNKKEGYFDGHWNSEKYFKEYRKEILKDFTLKHAFTAEAKKISEIIAKESNPVSLHIRRGDYLTIPKIATRHGVLPLSYYEEAMDYIVKKFPNAHLFIFSDDIEWAKEHFPRIHPVTFASDPSIEDYEEMTLMSMCKHNIIANSTFSWWGAWLNKNPGKIVIAPKQWMLDPSIDTSDVLPDSWLKL